jgi:hypothetical protein
MHEGAPTEQNGEVETREILEAPESEIEFAPAENAARQEILDAFGEHDEVVSVGTVQELLERIKMDTGLSQEEVERRFAS